MHVCMLVMIWNSFFFGIYMSFCLLQSLKRSFFVLFFSVSSFFLSPDLSPLFPVVKPVPTSSLFQFLWTSDTFILGTHILFASLTCGHFLTAVNHNLKVLSTTAHRSHRVQQHIITESINKGINHLFLTCKEYAMAYKNISIFNSFLKVTQKQIIMVQVK